jgi:hypothetical protein
MKLHHFMATFKVFGHDLDYDSELEYGDLYKNLYVLQDIPGWVPYAEQCMSYQSESNRKLWKDYLSSEIEKYEAALPELSKLDEMADSTLKVGYCAKEFKGFTFWGLANTLILYRDILDAVCDLPKHSGSCGSFKN